MGEAEPPSPAVAFVPWSRPDDQGHEEYDMADQATVTTETSTPIACSTPPASTGSPWTTSTENTSNAR